MYSERLLHHFQHPRNVGELPPPAVPLRIENPACGDILQLTVLWQDGRIADARYRVRGCTASIAAGSALAEWLPGRTPAELQALTAAAVEDWLGGLPSASRHAASLCVDAARALVRTAPAGPVGLDQRKL